MGLLNESIKQWVKENAIYRHFKGNYYLVKDIVEHTETGEEMVSYQALYVKNNELAKYVRPSSMFRDEIDRAGYKGPRFTYIPLSDEDVLGIINVADSLLAFISNGNTLSEISQQDVISEYIKEHGDTYVYKLKKEE